jgi:two-component system, sensor histidine kinase
MSTRDKPAPASRHGQVERNAFRTEAFARPERRMVTREIEIAPAMGDSRKRPSILVIEAYRTIADALQDLLRADGWDVGKAYDGGVGLTLAHLLRPDIVVCDLQLRGPPTAFQLARTLRADPALKGIRLVAITTLESTDFWEYATQSGYDQILRKPVDIEQIEALISGR